jgi:hypothetical protein
MLAVGTEIGRESPEGAICRIFIEDNGIGFDEKDLDLIFPFFRDCTAEASMRDRELNWPSAKKSSGGMAGASLPGALREWAQHL